MKRIYLLAGVLAAFLIAFVAFSPLLSAKPQHGQIPFSLATIHKSGRIVSTVTYTSPSPDRSKVTVTTQVDITNITGIIGTTQVSGTGNVTFIFSHAASSNSTSIVGHGDITLNIGSLTVTSIGSGFVSNGIIYAGFRITGNGTLSLSGIGTVNVTVDAAASQAAAPGPGFLPGVVQGFITF